VSGIEQELDRLFGLPLDEFTAARNELAKRLRAEGEAEAAAAVQALPKPSVAAWTINRVARDQPARVQTLLDAGSALRIAQERLLGGEEEASTALQDAAAREREAVRSLVTSAEDALKRAGRPATQAMLDRVAGTLHAAAFTEDGRSLLESGRFTVELEPSGFGEVAAPPRTAKRARSRRAAAQAGQPRRREQEQLRLRELREQARDLERAARSAEREARRAQATADDAHRRAEQARAEADGAAARVEQFRKEAAAGS
jgi:hypothetical protein